MVIDPSNFHKYNVIDTCAIWNILSSKLLYTTANNAGCLFCCTYFVYYECLNKPRKNPKQAEIELQNRFRQEYENGKFKYYHLTIEDLQDVEVLQVRKKKDKGELASIAFAKKTRQAFLTDDTGAKKLAAQSMNGKMVQNTPHLLAWLIFVNYLSDSDLQPIIDEHKKYNRHLEEKFLNAYKIVLEYRLNQ
jgi:predicted nucleic acid-binding protein